MSLKVLEFGFFPDLSEGSGFKLQLSFILYRTGNGRDGAKPLHFYMAETSDGPGRSAAMNWIRRRRYFL